MGINVLLAIKLASKWFNLVRQFATTVNKIFCIKRFYGANNATWIFAFNVTIVVNLLTLGNSSVRKDFSWNSLGILSQQIAPTVEKIAIASIFAGSVTSTIARSAKRLR